MHSKTHLAATAISLAAAVMPSVAQAMDASDPGYLAHPTCPVSPANPSNVLRHKGTQSSDWGPSALTGLQQGGLFLGGLAVSAGVLAGAGALGNWQFKKEQLKTEQERKSK